MDLQAFIRQVLEIQRIKDSQTLGYKELQEIALAMGLSKEDFEAAQAASFMRGKRHLSHENWNESIQEFQQVLILHPNHTAALFGLAKAHAGRWRRSRQALDKKRALHYAQLCLEIDPSYEEVYALVAQINRPKFSRFAHISKSDSSAHRPTISTAPQWLMAIGALFLLIYLFEPIPKSQISATSLEGNKYGQVTSIIAAEGAKGPVVWFIDYRRGQDTHQNYTAHIIDPIHNTTLKSFRIDTQAQKMTKQWDSPKYYHGSVYYYNEDTKDFEARDIYTGQITENKALLKHRFPQIPTEIEQVIETQDWYELILANGERFWYNPRTQTLASHQEKMASQEDYAYKKAWIDSFRWYQNADPLDKTFYLFRKKVSPFRPNHWSFVSSVQETILNHPRGCANWYGELLCVTEDYHFLNGFVLYSDAEICIIKHENDSLEKLGQVILSAVNAQGKKIWEKHAPQGCIVNAIQADNLSSYQIHRVGHQLLLSNPWLNDGTGQSKPTCSAWDLRNGAEIWEYTPKYPE